MSRYGTWATVDGGRVFRGAAISDRSAGDRRHVFGNRVLQVHPNAAGTAAVLDERTGFRWLVSLDAPSGVCTLTDGQGQNLRSCIDGSDPSPHGQVEFGPTWVSVNARSSRLD